MVVEKMLLVSLLQQGVGPDNHQMITRGIHQSLPFCVSVLHESVVLCICTHYFLSAVYPYTVNSCQFK